MFFQTTVSAWAPFFLIPGTKSFSNLPILREAPQTASWFETSHGAKLSNIGPSFKPSHQRKTRFLLSQEASQWHYCPAEEVFHLGEAKESELLMRGCDAIVTTLTLNESGEPVSSNHRWMRTFHPSSTIKAENSLHSITKVRDDESISCNSVIAYPAQSPPPTTPKEALEAIEATHRWAANFVRPLHLCPWAGSSLDTVGAIRYWVLVVDSEGYQQKDSWDFVLNEMENIVRKAGRHLEMITAPPVVDGGMDPIEPSVAISFVIVVPKCSSQVSPPSMSPLEEKTSPTEYSVDVVQRVSDLLPNFESFHDFFLDLEDQLLDGCDDYWEKIEDESSVEKNARIPLGCGITVAAFHPQWRFGSGGKDDEQNDSDSSIDFEKRTPYPTISLVMSSAIDALMSEQASHLGENSDNHESGHDEASTLSAPVTNRIATLNEKTLCAMGLEEVEKLFQNEVLKCPMKGFGGD